MLFNLMKNLKTYSLFLVIVLTLCLSRIIPHPPNFTPIISLAIMGPFLFGGLLISLICVMSSMFLSDLIIGVHSGMLQIYLIIILLSFIFSKYKNNLNKSNVLFFSIYGSTIFFIISNLNVWIFSNLYTKNLEGLINCYLMAIPFFHNTLISTIIFSYAIYFISRKAVLAPNYKY